MKRWLMVVPMLAVMAVFFYVPDAAGDASERTMTRSEDPVVVAVEKLGQMKDAAIERLALFAFSGGEFKPIPFQVDERQENGFYVFPYGPEANPEDGDGKVNGADELVFMVKDAGGRSSADARVPCDPSRTLELILTDPKDQGKAWVYLAECNSDPPRSPADYIAREFDGERDWVKSGRYHFAEARGTTYFDRLIMRGPDGKIGGNEVDRVKFRMSFTAAGGLIDLSLNEAAIGGSNVAWIDGPVRVVNLVQGYVQFSVIKLKIGGGSQNTFYPNYFFTPVKIDFPFSPTSLLKNLVMSWSTDWREGFNGTRYYDPVNTEGVVIDGVMSEAEKNMDYESDHDWYALTGPQGDLIVRLVAQDYLKGKVPIKVSYIDDKDADGSPEADPGLRCPGFKVDQMTEVPAGPFIISPHYMFPDSAPPASVPVMLDILDHPLEVKTGAFP